MVAWDAFMVEQRIDLGQRHVGHVVKVGIISAGARTIGGGALVEGLAGRFLAESLDAFYH